MGENRSLMRKLKGRTACVFGSRSLGFGGGGCVVGGNSSCKINLVGGGFGGRIFVYWIGGLLLPGDDVGKSWVVS